MNGCTYQLTLNQPAQSIVLALNTTTLVMSDQTLVDGGAPKTAGQMVFRPFSEEQRLDPNQPPKSSQQSTNGAVISFFKHLLRCP